MEPKFQTSFIPKKSMAPTAGPGVLRTSGQRHGTSVFMVIAVLIFIISLASVGGVYYWKQYLVSQREKYQAQLAQRKKDFNLELIQQLKDANAQIDTAKQLIANHIAISGLFKFIQDLTVEKVRFLNLDVSAGQAGAVTIGMSGYGADLKTVAFQAFILDKLERYGLRNIVKNPMLSNPSLDPKGIASFSLTASIDPSNLSYEKQFSESGSATSTP